MNAMSLSELPTSVLELHTWPWWRRFWNRPPALVRKRCEAWRELLGLKESAGKNVLLNTAKSKIFDDSRRRWDILDNLNRSNFTLRSRFSGLASGAKEAFQSPHGSLVQVTMVPHFECDASDIEGISASKSADMPHESVDVFGAYYIDEQNRYARKGKPPLGLDDASLKELCSHGEIRLLHGRGSDTFSVRAWDGRLFLDNSGGSHHLAGAVHVAKRIGARIHLASKLYLYQLNHLTVQWLLDGFHLVLLPKDLAGQMLWTVKSLVGSGSNMEFPPVLAEGTLLAFPRGSQIAESVMAELLSQGHHDLGNDLREALTAQQRFLTESTALWTKQFSSPTC